MNSAAQQHATLAAQLDPDCQALPRVADLLEPRSLRPSSFAATVL